MKMLKLTSLILSAIALSACGGGGSGGAGITTMPDGDKINLELSDKGFIGGKTTYGTFKGMNNDHSFYGVWVNNAKTLSEVRFQGAEATNLPRGSATYIGDAVWANGLTGNIRRGGSTILNVDFDEKTVEGKIAFEALSDIRSQDITLHQTKLDGSQFSGKASVLFNDNGTYEGALFGNGAKEAAGIVEFKKESELNTSFGGKRQ